LKTIVTGQVLDTTQTNPYGCDSLWSGFGNVAAVLDTSKTYLLCFTRYLEGECAGIYDTTDYYLNFCLMNLRMQTAPMVLLYHNMLELQSYLGNETVTGSALPDDIVVPGTSDMILDMDDLTITPPLVVSSGVVLSGDYDLLGEPVILPFNGSTYTVTQTSSKGTIIKATHKGDMVGNSMQNNGYMFLMEGNSSIYNFRLEGAMPGFQDHNDESKLSAGIRMFIGTNGTSASYLLQGCELYNFSYAGIFASQNTENVTIKNTIIHRVRGSGGFGTTVKPKGYGVWFQGFNDTGFADGPDFLLENCIVDESKTAVDLQHNPLDLTIHECTFGAFFNQETINRHGNNSTYSHPSTGISNCDYYVGSNTNPISGGFSMNDNASGDLTIQNSAFYKPSRVISVPYPVNTNSSNHLYNVNITDNTFVAPHDLPDAFIQGNSNNGGYARISDNYIESCTWDYERTNNSTSGPEIVINSPNFHGYLSTSNVTAGCSTCPDPPRPMMQITGYTGLVNGFSQNSSKIPFINEGENFGVDVVNSGNPSVYIVRAHPNNEATTNPGFNNSGNNPFNNAQVVTAPSTTTVSLQYGPSAQLLFDTNKPGLYGIDATKVSANTAPTDYYASDLIHQPIIIAPTNNHLLIFNIKDSYFSDLYDTPFLASGLVYKQVELNGNIIWQEDITEGGDDWEQVVVDLMDGSIPSYFNTTDPKNTLTFSIAIPDPSLVDINSLRGLMVWVDDVYLKRFDSPENLIRDGDIENSPLGGLSNTPTTAKKWYQQNAVTFGSCLPLDKPIPGTPSPGNYAASQASVGFLDRKSGRQSVLLQLDGLHNANGCTDYDDFSPVAPQGQVISAAIDFDYRDFIGCDDYDLLANSFSEFQQTDLASSGTTTKDGEFLFIDENITIGSGQTLQLIGCQVFVKPHNPPYTITVNPGGKLWIVPHDDTGSDMDIQTRLFACEDMWGGISNNGGSIDMFHMPIGGTTPAGLPSSINDALTAIDSDGGRIEIRYVDFDHNYQALKLHADNYSFNTNSFIRGCNFLCSDGEITKQPFTGIFPPVHAEISNVHNFSFPFGGTASGFKNTFSNALNGIYIYNSSVNLINNEFSNINNHHSHYHTSGKTGIGINIENTIPGNNLEVNIGGYGTNDPNSFENVNIGIASYRLCYDCNLNIINNNFDNSAFVPVNTNYNFFNTAITIQNPLMMIRPPSFPLVKIYNNTINNYRIAIHANGQSGIEVGGYDAVLLAEYGNTINYDISEFPLDKPHEGIWLQSCTGAKVVKNEITNTTFNTETIFRGIDIESSPDCDVNCNTIEKTGIALNFYANCNLTQLRENNFTDYGTGVMLSGPNGASINADQGGTNDAWDNEWHPLVGSSNLKVGGFLLGIPMGINWYHQDIDDPDPMYVYSPSPWNGNIVFPIPNQSSGGAACNDFLRISFNRLSNFGHIVGDSANYSTDSAATRYQSRLETYLAMLNDSTIIYQFDSLDTSFINFFTSMDTSNAGRFQKVLEIVATYPDSAAYMNSLISPRGESETLLKSFNTLYFDKIVSGDTLSPADSSSLEYLTLLSRSAYGEMVHNAASVLFYEVHPGETPLRLGSTFSQNPISQRGINTVDEVRIYPNPARKAITIVASSEMKKVEIWNTYGSLLIVEKCNDIAQQIDLSNVPAGIYFVKTQLLNSSIAISKFVVQK